MQRARHHERFELAVLVMHEHIRRSSSVRRPTVAPMSVSALVDGVVSTVIDGFPVSRSQPSVVPGAHARGWLQTHQEARGDLAQGPRPEALHPRRPLIRAARAPELTAPACTRALGARAVHRAAACGMSKVRNRSAQRPISAACTPRPPPALCARWIRFRKVWHSGSRFDPLFV
jgi:hypothetical protein